VVGVTLYVEGGGDSKTLKTACRKGFSDFLSKAGVTNRPRIVASGGRRQAFEDFCIALHKGDRVALLLVDSEDTVTSNTPWEHLAERGGDEWTKPDQATAAQCHLMVQCMETWLLADRDTLAEYFGQGFREAVLPHPSRSIESIGKAELYRALALATHGCKTKARYGKGEHSFELLGMIDPVRVTSASSWAQCFVTAVKAEMDGYGQTARRP
jgi:hypothetical protein